MWFVFALLWQKVSGRASAIAPPSETPDGEPAALGFGMHVPFGPMLAIAGLLYFLFFSHWVAGYFANLGELL